MANCAFHFLDDSSELGLILSLCDWLKYCNYYVIDGNLYDLHEIYATAVLTVRSVKSVFKFSC